MVYSRIFLFGLLCCFFQIANASESYFEYKSLDNKIFSTANEMCAYYIPVSPFNTDYTYNGTYRIVDNMANTVPPAIGLRVACSLKNRSSQSTTETVGGNVVGSTNNCPAQGENIGSLSFRRNGELFDPPPTVCKEQCLYDFSNAVAAQEVRTDGSITTLFQGDAISLHQRCSVDTEDETPPPINPCKTTNSQGQIVDKDYCDAPPEGCPSGYITGMFNGKKICVKQDQNDRDNCTPTLSDPYRCLPNQPNEPVPPNEDGSCAQGTVKVLVGTTYQCKTQEVPPNPDSSCPSGYIKQTYDNVSVCVPDNQIPDANNNCPLNTSLVTLSDGSKVCRSGNDDGGGGASEPTGSGGGSCDPSKDWLCKDFDLPDTTNLTINELELPDIDENKISWAQQCPPDETVTLLGKSYAFSYATTCSFLSTYIHPLFVAFGYFSGAMIIIGAVRK